MYTYQNPHPPTPMNPYQGQPQQPQVTPQQQQAQILHQQLMQFMGQAGFQLIQGTDRQHYFQNTMNGQLMPYQTALQQFLGTGAMPGNQNQVQYPQAGFTQGGGQQALGGRFTAVSPPANPYPQGSVQASVQRPQQAPDFPTDLGNRFGPSTATPRQSPVTTQPQTVKETVMPQPTTPSIVKHNSIQLGLVKTASKLATISQRHVDDMATNKDDPDLVMVGNTVRGIFAGEMSDVYKTGYKPVTHFNALLVSEFFIPTTDDHTKLLEIFTMTDAKGVYKAMRKMIDGKMTTEAKAALIGMDKNITSYVNDFLTIAVAPDACIDSFVDDFNALLKSLRDTTEAAEDDLIDYLKEVLTERSKDPQSDKDCLSISDRVELVRLGVLSEEIGFDKQGQQSKTFDEKLALIMEEVSRRMIYLQTLDNEIYKVYDLSTVAGKKFVVRPYCE